MLHVPEADVHEDVGHLEGGVALVFWAVAQEGVRPTETKNVSQFRGRAALLVSRRLQEAPEDGQVELDRGLHLLRVVVGIRKQLQNATPRLLQISKF